MIRKLLTILKAEGVRGIITRIRNRFISEAYGYEVELDKAQVQENNDFCLCQVTCTLIEQAAIQHPLELTKKKYEIIRDSLNSENTNRYYFILDRNENICGFCALAFADIYDSCIDYTLRKRQGKVHFYDDHTFEVYRGKGVHRFSIASRILLARDSGYKWGTANILKGNTISENNYCSHGFTNQLYFRYLHIGRYQNTSKVEISRDTNLVLGHYK